MPSALVIHVSGERSFGVNSWGSTSYSDWEQRLQGQPGRVIGRLAAEPAESQEPSAERLFLFLFPRLPEQWHCLIRAWREEPGPRVDQQLVSRIDDVEIAHRQLTDPVLRREQRLPLFHRQPLGLVGEVRAGRVQNRVIVAAPELDGDLAGNRSGYPSLRRFAKHHGLRVEPPALIEQTAETPAVLAVLFDRVLVVDPGDKPFVSDVEQRETRGFVDAAALGLDDAIFDLIAHPEPVAS